MSTTFNAGDRVEFIGDEFIRPRGTQGTCRHQPYDKTCWYVDWDHQPGVLRTFTPTYWLRPLDDEKDYEDDVTG